MRFTETVDRFLERHPAIFVALLFLLSLAAAMVILGGRGTADVVYRTF